MTSVRDVAPEPTDKQGVALDLLHAAMSACARSDRALAHCIRAALRSGLTWDTIEANIRLTHLEAVECITRWPGDD